MTGPRLSIIPARAATDPALKPRDLQVLCVLGRHTDDLGWCRRSQVKMAEEMGCARATVFDAIERLVKAGYLERHVQEHESGRDSAHVYRVVLDTPHPRPGAVPLFAGDRSPSARDLGAFGAPEAASPDGASPPADQPAPPSPPAGMSAPPAGPEAAPPAGPGPAPINDTPLTASLNGEREARAGEPEGGQTETANTDDPKKFESRVKALAAKVSWPGWATSSTGWTVAQFAKLDDGGRAEAERLAAGYIAHVGGKAVSLGVYFRDRKWTDLPAAALAAALAAAAPPALVESAPFGKAGMAQRLAALIAGPTFRLFRLTPFEQGMVDRGEADRDALMRAKQASQGFPNVTGRDGQRAVAVPVAVAALGEGFVQARRGDERFEDWRAEHEARGWPWIPAWVEWVWLPPGPAFEAVEAFAAAVKGGQEAVRAGGPNGDAGNQHEHGGGREAAE